MPAWGIWLVLAALLGIGEALSLTFVLGLSAVAALLAGGAALLGAPVAGQLSAFLVGELVLLVGVRPLARRAAAGRPALATGIDALVGAEGVVVERVDETGGRVRIRGELWSARPMAPHAALDPGVPVTVLRVDGATALVYERDLL